jgi:4-hydroxy-tetrahydrodipicolinate synthase
VRASSALRNSARRDISTRPRGSRSFPNWDLVWNDKLIEAMDYAEKSGLDQFGIDMGSWFTCYPGRPDYFTHWGGAFKYAASVLGQPIGDYPHSRPPQAEFPAEGKAQIDAAYRGFGLVPA